MILYLGIIFGGMVYSIIINTFVFPQEVLSIWMNIFWVCFNVVALIAIDAVFAWIIHALPRKWFSPYKKIYHVHRKERKIYDALRIKVWKDSIPEMGGKLCDFPKDKIDNNDPEYLMMFLQETGYAEIIHYFMAFSSIVNFFIFYFAGFPMDQLLIIVLPLAIINFVLQIPPILIQRYNRPRLLIMYERELKIRERKKTS